MKVAPMGELVDPLDLSSSSYCGVWVRVPLGVQKWWFLNELLLFFYFFCPFNEKNVIRLDFFLNLS